MPEPGCAYNKAAYDAASKLNGMLRSSKNLFLLQRLPCFSSSAGQDWSKKQQKLVISCCLRLKDLETALRQAATSCKLLLDVVLLAKAVTSACLLSWVMQCPQELARHLLFREEGVVECVELWHLCTKCLTTILIHTVNLEFLQDGCHDENTSWLHQIGDHLFQELDKSEVFQLWPALLEQLLLPAHQAEQQQHHQHHHADQQQHERLEHQHARCIISTPEVQQAFRCWSNLWGTWARTRALTYTESLTRFAQPLLQQVQRCIAVVSAQTAVKAAGMQDGAGPDSSNKVTAAAHDCIQGTHNMGAALEFLPVSNLQASMLYVPVYMYWQHLRDELQLQPAEVTALQQFLSSQTAAEAALQQLAAYWCMMRVELDAAQSQADQQDASNSPVNVAQHLAMHGIPECSSSMVEQVLPDGATYITALAMIAQDAADETDDPCSKVLPMLSFGTIQIPIMKDVLLYHIEKHLGSNPTGLSSAALQLLVELQLLLFSYATKQLQQTSGCPTLKEASAAKDSSTAASSTQQQCDHVEDQQQQQQPPQQQQQGTDWLPAKQHSSRRESLPEPGLQDSMPLTEQQQVAERQQGSVTPEDELLFQRWPVAATTAALFMCNELLLSQIAAIMQHSGCSQASVQQVLQHSGQQLLHAIAAPIKLVQLSLGLQDNVVSKVAQNTRYMKKRLCHRLLAMQALTSSSTTRGLLDTVIAAQPEAYLDLLDCCVRSQHFEACDMRLVAELACYAPAPTSTKAAVALASALASITKRAAVLIKAAGAGHHAAAPLQTAYPGYDGDSTCAAQHFPVALPWLMASLAVIARKIYTRAPSSAGDRASSTDSNCGMQQLQAIAALLRVVMSRSVVVLADALASAAAAAGTTQAQLFARCVMARPEFRYRWIPEGPLTAVCGLTFGALGRRQDFSTAGQFKFLQLWFVAVVLELHGTGACDAVASAPEACIAVGSAAGSSHCAVAAASSSSSSNAPCAGSAASSSPHCAESSTSNSPANDSRDSPLKWGYLLSLPADAHLAAVMQRFLSKRKDLEAAMQCLSSRTARATPWASAASTASAAAGAPQWEIDAEQVHVLYSDAVEVCRTLVAAVPVPLLCNNPACDNLSGVVERAVAVKMCAGCHCLYCCAACQTTDWPRHRNACKRMSACGQVCA